MVEFVIMEQEAKQKIHQQSQKYQNIQNTKVESVVT